MTDMTPKQARYLSYIHGYLTGFKVSPSVSEIAAALGVASPTAHQMLRTLERKGLIRREAGVARSIEILANADAIPTWRGKRITRAVWQWLPANPAAIQRAAPRSKIAADAVSTIHRFKITLLDTRPIIWRRIETKDVTLEQLHELTQTAMGWKNSHMHRFEIAGEQYTHPRFMTDESDEFGDLDYSDVRVSNLVSEHGAKFSMIYVYDFGDDWRHEVVLEEVAEMEPRIKYPRCIDGAGACPPEDVGGIPGFDHYCAVMKNPRHDEYRELLKWHGPFDPARFDPARATQRMKKGLPAW